MTASPAPQKHPTSEKLLAIDALPVWGARAGVPRAPAAPRRAREPSHSGAKTASSPRPIQIATVQRPAPKAAFVPLAAARKRPARSGGWSIGLGIAAGIVAIWPFLDLEAPETGASAAGALRYPPATLASASLVAAAFAAVIAPAAAAPISPTEAETSPSLAIPAGPVRDIVALAPSDPEAVPEGRVLDASEVAEAAAVVPMSMAVAEIPTLDAVVAVAPRAAGTDVTESASPRVFPARSSLETAKIASPIDGVRAAPRARIVIHYSGRAGRPAAEATASRLGRQGMKDVELRQVAFAIRNREVRIFSAQDTARASRVASAANPGTGALPISDFRHYRPSPSAGLVEVWVR